MPQLEPFFFVNSIIIVILSLSVILYVLSIYVLPLFPRVQLMRVYVSML